jgi:predicted dithiol-disulfide oxidoreductase (DUF899 family)
MAVAFPGESAEYRAARNRLLDREIERRRAMEAVAAARRRLPPGGAVPEDYAFQAHGPGGGPAEVRLSELFAPGKDSLVIYSMMFPRAPDDTSPGPPGGQTALLPLAEGPCPSCTALLDQLDGAAEHAAQHVNLAVAAKAPLDRVLTFAAERGWRRLRLLSSAGTSYNRDYLAETADGSQQPMLNVFHRDGDTIRHFWGSELFYAPVDPGQEPATSAPSSHCGTCSTSPGRATQPIGMSSSATDRPGCKDADHRCIKRSGSYRKPRPCLLTLGPRRRHRPRKPAVIPARSSGRPALRPAVVGGLPGWHRARAGHAAAVVFVLVDEDGRKGRLPRRLRAAQATAAGDSRFPGRSGRDPASLIRWAHSAAARGQECGSVRATHPAGEHTAP